MTKYLKEHAFDFLSVLLLVIAMLSLFALSPFDKIVVSGESMESTLYDGERGWIVEGCTLNRYDIIVFSKTHNKEDKSSLLIKRIVGLPGDRVVCKSHTVYVNGDPIIEFAKDASFNTDFEEVIVPPCSYFVLGDNREISLDSRYDEIGFVPESCILGKYLQ